MTLDTDWGKGVIFFKALIRGEIVGLVKAGEMMICTADENQLMPDFTSFGFAYITPISLKI